MSKINELFKKNFLSNKRVIDSLAKSSVILSPWMRDGIFFFHQGRCGSSVIANLLNQHPNISSYGEIFNQYWQKKRLPTKPENMLRMCQVRSIPNYAIVEAKFFDCQHLSLLNLSISEFVDLIKRCGFKKFIILNRRNYLKKIVSVSVAIERGFKWHYKTSDETPRVTIHLDIENVRIMGKTSSIIDMFNYMDEQYQNLSIALAGEDVLKLTYEEDILDDPMLAYTKVCNWLGVNNLPTKIEFRRTNVMELSEVIENWSEVLKVLSGTQYGWMVK